MKSFFDRIFGKKDPKETPSPPASSSREEPSKAVEIEQEKISVPSESMPKPPIISEIEKIIGKELHPAPPGTQDDLHWVKPFHRKKAKYAWHNGNLIGLNLGGIGLTDDQWAKIKGLSGLNLTQVRVLNLYMNKLTEFRLGSAMRGLESIDLGDNPLEFPAEEITKQGNEAILRFLKEIEAQGEGRLYEVKLLIVGEGGTGKTTLWHKLQNINHKVPLPPSEQPVTVGISIKEGWCFNHPEDKMEKFFVNLWDFGGQEIQYMTHQFFLTPRSFYILMADGRREIGNFPYWLKIINLLGHDPKQKEKTPVLVVINKKGNPSPTIPYDPQKALTAYPNLELIRCDVDLAVMDFELKNLPKRIQDLLCTRIPHLPLRIPKRWEAVREALKKMKEEGTNHITFDAFQEICKDNHIEDLQQVKDLSRTLHELGVILHYQDENALKLRNFVVLNPDWAVEAVYEILKHEEVGDNQGRFDNAFLTRVWDAKGYTYLEQGHLVDMMLKHNFEICFEATEKGIDIYIAPQMLPNDPPEGFSWEVDSQTLQYIYQYPFMPKGLVGRLIVRMNEYIQSIQDKKLLWKKGVLLTLIHPQSQQPAEALIEETTAPKTGGKIIHIKVKAEDYNARQFLLGLIRQEFHKLHTEVFANLEYYEKIPCCCMQCLESQEPHFYTLESLNNYKEKGIPHIRCEESLEEVSIQLLLDLISIVKGDRVIPRNTHVRNLIAKGSLEAALEELKRLAPEEMQDGALQIQSRYYTLKEKISKGVIAEGSNLAVTQWNAISDSALVFCSQLENRPI